MADTIEDSPHIERHEKQIRLMQLHNLLIKAENRSDLSEEDIISLYKAIDSEKGDDHRLLTQSSQLFEILKKLPQKQQTIIYHWVAEMALGMAEYSQMAPKTNGEIAALRDLADWDRYCYFVAGTVGNMLTDLFTSYYELPEDIVKDLSRFATSFGLGLQKVNVIKDVPDDRARGVCFLPISLMAKYNLNPSRLSDKLHENEIREFVAELTELTLVHLDDAIKYTALFPARYKGVRMFLTVPILLAVETLNLIKNNPIQTMTGPPVKISRKDVARLVATAARYSSSNEGLKRYYLKMKNKN